MAIPVGAGAGLVEHLEMELAFQKRWRGVMMKLYSFATAGAILLGAAATLLAALEYSVAAAIAAASTTVLVSMEKGLLFRERWKLHTVISTRLLNIQLDLETEQIDADEGVREVKAVRELYAEELPMERRPE